LNDIVRILQAAEFAADAHAHQRRKGEKAEPYLNHLIEVAALVADATDGDADAVIAALLHDTIEDTNATAADIESRFGRPIAALVLELTDDKSLTKHERRNLQVAKAPHKSRMASVIKLVDKTSNLRAIAASPPPWPEERKRAYVEWAKEVVAGLPNKPAGLLKHFQAAAAAALATIDRAPAAGGGAGL
jgi:(p)ppGpp synthase/HD superfamily hydrolase